jgi:hypothetical protein
VRPLCSAASLLVCKKSGLVLTFLDRKKLPLGGQKYLMGQVFEIHKYKGESFMYVVARTNKHEESYVRSDVDKMNSMLSPEMKAEGIRYVFALGTVESMNKKTGDRTRKKDKAGGVLEKGTPAS